MTTANIWAEDCPYGDYLGPDGHGGSKTEKHKLKPTIRGGLWYCEQCCVVFCLEPLYEQ